MRNLCKFSLLCMLVVLQIACRAYDESSPESTSTPTLAFLEQTIYKKAVSEFFPKDSTFLVLDKTTTVFAEGTMVNDLEGVHEDTLTDFNTKNHLSHRVDQTLQLNGGVTFASISDLKKQFGTSDPQMALELNFGAVGTDYPEILGVLEVSKVGFNAAMDQALVGLVFYDMSGHCLEYHAILLSKHDGSWEVENPLLIEQCS